MAKLTDPEITEVSSLDDSAFFYSVDTTRATGDQDTRITKANLKTQLAPTTPTLQEVTTQGATTTDAFTIQNELTVGDGAETIINTTDGSIEDDGAAMTIRHTSALILNSPTLRKTNGEEITSFNGAWNASTNSPTLANTDNNKKAIEYKVSTAGSVDFGAGSITFAIGDIVANDGSIWYKKVNNSQSGGTTNYFNITDFGVVGDGSDETTAIASAITTISEGSTVYFPSGTYATDSSIIINKRLTIIGNGSDTVFKTFTAENELGIDKGVITVTANNVVIRNITIDGNYTISTGGGANRNSGLYVDANVQNTIVKNLIAYHTPRQGLCVVGANGSYENITVYDTARHNISVGDGENTANVAKNNYFSSITCLGGQDAAFEVNDGSENIYVRDFNFSGSFVEKPVRIITHDRLNETNKNITFENGIVTSNIGCVDVKSDSATEANENIKFINVDFVGSGFLIDVNEITRGLTIENCSVSTTGTKIRIQGEASSIIIKNLLIKDYTNGAIVNILGDASLDIKDVSIDKIYFDDDWNGGNAQMLFNYINGLTIKNVNLAPTTSTAGDCFQIQNSHSIEISSCNISNYTSRLIVFVSCEDVLVDSSFLSDPGGNAIDASSSTTNLTIRKTKISGSPNDGIETNDCTNIIIDNCELTNNDFGLFSTNDSVYKILNGTQIHNNNDISGAEFDGTDNITIANSTIRNNHRHGLRILGGSFVNMNNNQIYNNNTSNIGGSGLQLRTDNLAIENIQITNNNIYDDQGTTTQDYAIDYRVDSGTLTNIIITGNMLKDAFNATFTPSATVIVDNNIEY